jgi:hypothetical protein
LLASLASFEFMRDRLVSLNFFPPETVIRHFNRKVFELTGHLLRISSALVLLAASGLLWLRDAIARTCAPACRALVLGWRHARRHSVEWSALSSLMLSLTIVSGIALRILFINRTIRYDEAFTVLDFASKPFYVGLILYTVPNNHILHTLLVHWAILLFGTAEWAIRIPAFVAGVLLVPLTYEFARKFVSPTAGFLAAAFTATSSILIEYSINARGYTMICAFALAVAICAIEIRKQVSPFWCALFAFFMILGFWTIPIFLFSVGGPLAWLIWESFDHGRRYRRLFWKRILITIALAGICTICLYTPVIALNGPAALVANKYVSSHAWPVLLKGNWPVLKTAFHEEWMRDLGTLLPIAMCFAALLGIAVCRDMRRFVLVTLGWAVSLLLVFRFVPFPRNWLMYLPIFYSAVASGAAWILEHSIPSSARKLSVLAAVLLILFATGMPVLRSRSVAESTETGVLLGVDGQVAYLAKRNVWPGSVYRDGISEMPLQYLWWRRLGKEQPSPTAAEVKLFEPPEAWIVVNLAAGLDLASIMRKLGIAEYEVLETAEFTGSKLYRVRWTR